MHLIYKVTYIMFHAKNTKNLRQWLLQICISSSFSMTLVSFSTNINNLIASLVSSKCSHFKVLNQLKMQSNETIWTPVSLNGRAEIDKNIMFKRKKTNQSKHEKTTLCNQMYICIRIPMLVFWAFTTHDAKSIFVSMKRRYGWSFFSRRMLSLRSCNRLTQCLCYKTLWK